MSDRRAKKRKTSTTASVFVAPITPESLPTRVGGMAYDAQEICNMMNSKDALLRRALNKAEMKKAKKRDQWAAWTAKVEEANERIAALTEALRQANALKDAAVKQMESMSAQMAQQAQQAQQAQEAQQAQQAQQRKEEADAMKAAHANELKNLNNRLDKALESKNKAKAALAQSAADYVLAKQNIDALSSAARATETAKQKEINALKQHLREAEAAKTDVEERAERSDAALKLQVQKNEELLKRLATEKAMGYNAGLRKARQETAAKEAGDASDAAELRRLVEELESLKEKHEREKGEWEAREKKMQPMYNASRALIAALNFGASATKNKSLCAEDGPTFEKVA